MYEVCDNNFIFKARLFPGLKEDAREVQNIVLTYI